MRIMFLVAAFALISTVASAGAIQIKPGQCVVLNGQEVCALSCDPTTTVLTTNAVKDTVTYKCRYAKFDDAELRDVKTYGLVETTLKPSGAKMDNMLKNYGLKGKEECEKAADEKNAAASK